MFQKVFLKLTRARRLRSGMTVLCAMAVIVLVAVGASPLLALGTVTMEVDPVTRVVPVNGTFTVDINLTDVAEMDPDGLGAYEFDLAFDPSIVQVDGVVDGDLLGSTGRSVFAEDGFCGEDPENPGEPVCTETDSVRIDNEAGLVSFAAFSVGSGLGSTEDGTLAVITFSAIKAGTTALNLIDEAEAAGNPEWDSYSVVLDTQANLWPDGGEGRELNVEDGTVTVVLLSGDYDGDGSSDIGFYREGLWGILKSSADFEYDQAQWFAWGAPGDSPVVGDFDGDGKADPTIRHPPDGGQSAAYLILKSSTGYDYGQVQVVPAGWPSLGDTPVPGGFDGDGATDPGTWRETSGVWMIPKSSAGFGNYIFAQWGTSGDVPLP